MKVILASGSFLKNYIIEKTAIPYEVVPANIDESIYDHLDVGGRVVALAQDKCRRVAEQYPDRIVIAADTLTAHKDGTVFSKPEPESDPLDAALQLSGETIEVYTGCCVYTPKNRYADTLARARIEYQEFTRNRLEVVAKDDSPQIRSGALGVFVDAPGFTLIKEVSGSYTGMYGLPMEFVYEQLSLAE